MKFLCDKCKTRYSIGEDRVRGKILKIRCKNCANVITVREGMPEPAPDVGDPARPRSNSAAPTLAGSAPQGGALGAAFASQLAKPPPALEQEWYVSIDGNQEGPYTLAQAQKWVTGKPFEAELHCWSEGFDDWLPVDKVSHFRNLRKRPVAKAPTIPPPIPKPQPRAEEPKPLFAATMASIEKSASQKLPALAPAPTLQSHSAVPAPARANGIAPFPAAARGTAPAQAFRQDLNDQMTAVEAPAFNDEIATAAEPAAARRLAGAPAPTTPATSPVKPIFQDEPEGDDDGLEIGEVSRVVKLTDIAAMGKPKSATASTQAMRASAGWLAPAAAVARASGLTGSVQKLSPSELGMNVDPSLASIPGAPMPDESVVARSFASRHRRGMMLLIAVSAFMVLGVVAVVVFVASGGEGDLPVGLGGTRVIDTSRPEDIVRKQLPPPPNAVKDPVTQRPRYTGPRNTGNITTQQPDTGPDTGPGSRLDASEVEQMAAKYGEGTKRCYMRAQKGALGFEIAETKKIDVTLTVAKDGTVNDVQLSKHASNEFGQCLIARIKGWRFRESKGGTFRIALAFSSG